MTMTYAYFNISSLFCLHSSGRQRQYLTLWHKEHWTSCTEVHTTIQQFKMYLCMCLDMHKCNSATLQWCNSSVLDLWWLSVGADYSLYALICLGDHWTAMQTWIDHSNGKHSKLCIIKARKQCSQEQRTTQCMTHATCSWARWRFCPSSISLLLLLVTTAFAAADESICQKVNTDSAKITQIY